MISIMFRALFCDFPIKTQIMRQDMIPNNISIPNIIKLYLLQ